MLQLIKEIEAKQKEIEEKLAAIRIEHTSADGQLRVILDGNKKVRDLWISPELVSSVDAEQLADLLIICLDEAMQRAASEGRAQIESEISTILPGFGGPGSPFTA